MKAIALFALAALAASAQTPPPPAKAAMNRVIGLIVRSAEKMPEENYAFKPVDGVRTFGQLVGHTIDANNMFCSALKGEANPNPGIEKGKTAKADLVAAAKASQEYCASVAAPEEGKMAKMGTREVPAAAVVFNVVGHTWEHYGNLVTYMRIKGVVPPSSEPR